uniref:wolframin-like isoform X2 n=1 Tax=Myxine glutinosa TaxID=7769 RepID=UPI00358FF5EE
MESEGDSFAVPSVQNVSEWSGGKQDEKLNSLLEKAKANDTQAQVEVAEAYLHQAEETKDNEINETAVSWLLRAARQGKKKAVVLLRDCVEQNKGITVANEVEVRRLTGEAELERSLRKASHRLFACINPGHKSSLPLSEALNNAGSLAKADGEDSSQHVMDKKVVAKLISGAHKDELSAEDILEMTKDFFEGIPSSPSDLLSTFHDLAESNDSPTPQYANLPLRQKLLSYPYATLIGAKNYLMESASNMGTRWIKAALPLNQINTIVVFFMISTFTTDFLGFIVPLVIFYLSFGAMVVCTLRIVRQGRDWAEFRKLTDVLLRYDPSLDMEEVESSFSWSHLEPYLHFLLATLLAVMAFPITDQSWVPCPELAFLSIILALAGHGAGQVAGVVGLFAHHAVFAQLSSAVLRGLDGTLLPESIAWTVKPLVKPLFTVPLTSSIALTFGFPAVLYMYLIYCFFRMASARGFRGIYSQLVPHLVTFVWLEMFTAFLQVVAPVGLVRAASGLFLFFFALPALLIGLFTAAGYAFFHWIIELELTKLGVTLVLCSLPLAIRYWKSNAVKCSADSSKDKTKRYAVWLLLFCFGAIMALCFLNAVRFEGTVQDDNRQLSLLRYSTLCGPEAWQSSSVAQTQEKCAHLEGNRVTWVGRLNTVSIVKTENSLDTFLKLLPSPAANWLRCVYGERYSSCNTEEQNDGGDLINDAACQMSHLASHDCHVKRLGHYTFKLLLEPLDSPEAEDAATGVTATGVGQEPIVLWAALPNASDRFVSLLGGSEFRQLLLRVENGNLFQVSTVLAGSDLGNYQPAFDLRTIHCLDCPESWAGPWHKQKYDWYATVQRSIRFAFNFLFAPVLTASSI